MKFLAIDTANEYLTVLAYKDGVAEHVYRSNCSMRHSTELMKAVEEALEQAGMTADECEFFAAVVGAGSFTGIRIGISAAKGFCLAYGKPALPVTSFELSAYNAIGREEKTLCIVNALHDAYYVCGFDQNGGQIYAPAYLTEAEVLSLVAEGYCLRALGEGECTLGIAQKAPVAVCDAVQGLQNAVLAKAARGEFGRLDALYVRKSSAELNLQK